MKPTAIRTFLSEFLEEHGAETSEPDAHRLQVQTGPELAPKLGCKKLSLAFNARGLSADPGSELATVGNPVFDQILELAMESGRVGIRYQRHPEPGTPQLEEAPDPSEHFDLGSRWSGFGESYQTYIPLYCHVFRVESSIDNVADVLEVVCIDGAHLTSLPQTPDLSEYWRQLESNPEVGRIVTDPLPVPEVILQRAIEAMAKRLRKRTSRLRRAAEERLSRETESIAAYYQSLVAETRSASRRWAGGPTARDEKIRILQLDWKRRMEEARSFWMPRVDVSLVGVGVMQTPRTAYPLRTARGGGGRATKFSVLYDPQKGVFSVPAGVESVVLRSE